MLTHQAERTQEEWTHEAERTCNAEITLEQTSGDDEQLNLKHYSSRIRVHVSANVSFSSNVNEKILKRLWKYLYI